MPGILILVMAVFAVAYGLAIWQISKNIRARKWPTVEGRMVDATVKESVSADEYHSIITYDVVINYRYVVEGLEYSGASHVTSFPHIGEAENSAASYVPGTAVEVFYHPKRPKDSMLEAGKGIGCNVVILILMLLPLLGGVILILFDIL